MAHFTKEHGKEQTSSARCEFGEIVTEHPKMLQLLQVAIRVAKTRSTVLLRGETGTGKDLVARLLHTNSERRDKPLVSLHLAALPESVVDAELFGHVKGAFTGAERARAGRIKSAAGGTLFLDEVAEIPLHMQAKLLRFLQFGEIQPVGSDVVERVDVRVIAATHQDLKQAVEQGRFRQDLYFRLKVIELEIPPLRERRSDIPLLIYTFLKQYWRGVGEPPRLSPKAALALREYDYPGNVRELSQMIERASILSDDSVFDVDLFPIEVSVDMQRVASSRFVEYTAEELVEQRRAAVNNVEREFVSGLMKKYGGNVSDAARNAGMHRSYLQRLIVRQKR
jgi:Nif-specific regulatory protein/two-component system response regulator HydG